MRSWPGIVVMGLVLAAGAGTGEARQMSSPTQTITPPPPGPVEHDSRGAEIERKQARMRNDERQKKLVADTDKLLELATSLHEDVAKTNRNVLSVEVIRRADEIERLAHAVKERMRD